VSSQSRRAGDKKTIGAVVLAAGVSKRLGMSKQMLEFRGEPLVRRAASAASQAGCSPIVVVTGAKAEATRHALHKLNVREVENQQWQSGLSSSIRAGVAAVIEASERTDAVVLMLCDQPFVTREVVRKLINAYRETGCSIVASSYGETFGVPALFEKSHYRELMALEGAVGAKQVIQKHLARAQLVNFPEGAIDIDTPDDLTRLD
jgi:molybdenum cofactor cytidylyltransferase